MELVNIFKANTRKSPIDPSVSFEQLAKATEGFSAADITEICQRAAKNAIREAVAASVLRAKQLAAEEEPTVDEDSVKFIRKDHFEEAMSRARRSVSDKDIQRYDEFKSKMKADSMAAGAGNFEFGEDKNDADGDDGTDSGSDSLYD